MSISATPQPVSLLDRFADMAEGLRDSLDAGDMNPIDVIFTLIFLHCLMRVAAFYVRWKAGLLPRARRSRATPVARDTTGRSRSDGGRDETVSSRAPNSDHGEAKELPAHAADDLAAEPVPTPSIAFATSGVMWGEPDYAMDRAAPPCRPAPTALRLLVGPSPPSSKTTPTPLTVRAIISLRYRYERIAA
jgi:hypothetical protein